MLARSPDAVKVLERLQQQERESAGEAPLSVDPVPDLRQALEMQLMSQDFDRGGLEASIQSVGTPERAREVERRVQEVLHSLHLDDRTQWSRYERPDHAWRIADLCNRIEAVMGRHGWRLAEAPVVGSLATGQVSAMTQRAPGNGATLILVENGFFTFAHALAQLAVLSLHDENLLGPLRKPAVQLMSDIVGTQTVLGTCLYLYPRPNPGAMHQDVAAFEDAIALFVLGHEYAHLHAGDLDAHPAGGVERARHGEEFRADEFGLAVAMEAVRDNGLHGVAVFGPFLFLAGLDVLARAAAAYEGRPAPDKTDPLYPTPYERARHLLSMPPEHDLWRGYGEPTRAASRCYNVLLGVWELVRPSFWALRERLAVYRPGAPGPLMLPEWRTYAVVSTLWQHVLGRLQEHDDRGASGRHDGQ